MDDQAKPAADPVMDDPKVKADQAQLAEDVAAAKQREAQASLNVAQAAHEAEAASVAPAGIEPNKDLGGLAHGGGDPNVPQSGQAPATDPVAPTVDEVAAKQREENLQRAIANGYREPPAPTAKESAEALIAGMEHQVTHNGPITLEMLSQLRQILQLPAQPAPVAEG